MLECCQNLWRHSFENPQTSIRIWVFRLFVQILMMGSSAFFQGMSSALLIHKKYKHEQKKIYIYICFVVFFGGGRVISQEKVPIMNSWRIPCIMHPIKKAQTEATMDDGKSESGECPAAQGSDRIYVKDITGESWRGGQNVPKSKTSRGWPVGNHFSRPSENAFWGGHLREILGVCKGLTKRNGIGGGQNVPRWGGSETAFDGGSPREVLPPSPFPPPLWHSLVSIQICNWTHGSHSRWWETNLLTTPGSDMSGRNAGKKQSW